MVVESDISQTVVEHFQSKGLCARTEVPLLSKWIDVVAYDISFDRLTLVETKISKWRSALQQASVYTLCSPDVYIAIAKEYSHRVDVDSLRGLGLGLLEVDGNVNYLLEPSCVVAPQPSVRRGVIEFLKSTGE